MRIHRAEGDVLPFEAAVPQHADVGVLTGGGSAQVDAPGGSPVPPPPAKDDKLRAKDDKLKAKDDKLRAKDDKLSLTVTTVFQD